VAFDPAQFDKFVGFCQLNPDAFFTVTRHGKRYFARLTGQAQRNGEPGLEIMSPSLIAAARQQWQRIQQWNRRVGKFENLVFLHVSQQGQSS
jgi:hypothetical protein